MNNTAMLPSDWRRNPGMALRTARYACFEHDSLQAFIDVCPPENSEGLFDVDSDSYAVAKLYTSHEEFDGVQYRDQVEVETEADVAIVVRDLADTFYSEFATDIDTDERDEPTPGLVAPDDWPEGAENKTLDDF
jgi:hypothetical protein